MTLDERKPSRLIRSNRKSVAIEIRPNESVILRVPHRLSEKEALAFFESKKAWVEKKLKQLRKENDRKSDFQLKQILVEGELFPLELREDISVPFMSDELLFLPKENSDYHKYNYLYQRAQEKLLDRAWNLAKKHGCSPRNIRLSDAKKRWGSCSSNKSINLAWRLIQVSPFCQDYVICHEFAHLKEMNHSKKFWKLVEKMQPSYKDAISWIKMNRSMFI